MAAPSLYFQPGGIAERVLARCDELKRPFSPTVWATNPHVQSAVGMLRTLSARGAYTRQLVMTSDHGTLALDWWRGGDRRAYAAADAPIALFIHGINGGSHEGYVKWACVAAAARGWRAVVLNMRGCNGLPLTSARGYNAINTADVHVAVSSIRARFPAAPLMAVGYSLGSVLLAKYLAEADAGLYDRIGVAAAGGAGGDDDVDSSAGVGDVGAAVRGDGGQQRRQQQQQQRRQRQEAPPPPHRGSGLVAAALVSPPVCLHTTNLKMGQPTSFKFLYNLAVAYKLREYVKEHLPAITTRGGSAGLDTDALRSSWTVAAFDDAVTLRLLGYAAPALYYRHACSSNYLPHIRTPTLILLSRDDPFLGVLPRAQAERNPFTLLAATRRGGHLAFLQGFFPLGASYCDAAVDGWLAAALAEWRHSAAPAAGQQQQQHASWEDRARAAGWRPAPFDPATLADVLCSCTPLSPRERAALDAATATAAKAGGGAAAATTGAAGAGAAASSPRQAWSFGFSRPPRRREQEQRRRQAQQQVIGGLRGAGAWAPFEEDDGGGGNGDEGSTRATVADAAARRRQQRPPSSLLAQTSAAAASAVPSSGSGSSAAVMLRSKL